MFIAKITQWLRKYIKPPLRWSWRRFKAINRHFRPQKLQNECWAQEWMLMRKGLPLKCIFDIGANRGQSSFEFIRLFPGAMIYAIEPVPSLADKISAAFKDHPCVRVLNMALGEEEEERLFHIYDCDEASSFLQVIPESIPGVQGLSDPEKVRVRLRRLDKLLGDLNVHSVDLMKMDAQGYESRILEGAGAALERVQAVYSEVNFGRIYKDQSEFWQLDQKLRSHGFWFFRFCNEHHSDDGRLLWSDALWLNGNYISE